ncbi:hypothetical protein Sjap_013216 [Stephania japonica]|uniref:Uncharacterized protein n=1 Tax=Stephania japonica TaxID=461633 RepID=A0AAP0IXK9_9MAGN
MSKLKKNRVQPDFVIVEAWRRYLEYMENEDFLAWSRAIRTNISLSEASVRVHPPHLGLLSQLSLPSPHLPHLLRLNVQIFDETSGVGEPTVARVEVRPPVEAGPRCSSDVSTGRRSEVDKAKYGAMERRSGVQEARSNVLAHKSDGSKVDHARSYSNEVRSGAPDDDRVKSMVNKTRSGVRDVRFAVLIGKSSHRSKSDGNKGGLTH